MELVVRKNELLRELQLFQGIVERKNTIPILANVLIEAKGTRSGCWRRISKWP
jgi:DNA polymerase-3 subunit beta